ncbi:hypothetical protein BD410DRAFT_294926 [Rickenella mellea]|uniref:Uncharacterized protein n=1 Tax=Rickenella mellea TaxID=50990 RepID=A0A4Y7Q2L8_9AGAM|nr:hypothetical protein BD410DRAFT_294926 [Rickenella mellea]
MVKRQHPYRNEINLYDSHAISWALQWSKESSIVFATLSSVPDFISSHHDFSSWCKVNSILSNPESGIVLEVLRILRSFVSPFGHIRERHLVRACLETLPWLTRCSTMMLSHEEGESILDLEADQTEILWDILELIIFHVDEDMKRLCAHAMANLVLRHAYKLELCLNASSTQRQNRKQWLMEQRILVMTTMGFSSRFIWPNITERGLRDYRGIHDFANARFLRWDLRREWELHENLPIFRSEFAAQIFHSCDPISTVTSLNSLRSLCDIATHLREFPRASRETQVYIFKLVDAIKRHLSSKPQRQAEGNASFNQMEYSLAYGKYENIVFGQRIHDWASFVQRPQGLYSEFFKNVRVYDIVDDFTLSSGTIGIRLHLYSDVMKDVFNRLQSSATLEEEWQCQNPSPLVIQRFLAGRVLGAGELQCVSLEIDAEHLIAVRALRASWSALSALIDATAYKLGYDFQLRDDYNVDMHAELQFYDLDAECNVTNHTNPVSSTTIY